MNERINVFEVLAMKPHLLGQLSEVLIRVVEDGASIGFLPPLSEREAKEYWEQAMAPGVRLWVAEKNGLVAGTVQLHLAMKPNAAHRAEIAKLMVSPEARRCGIARMLMQTAEEAARRESRTLLVLDTREGDPSNALYRALGFIEAGKIPRYARSADGNLDGTVFYYKEISLSPRLGISDHAAGEYGAAGSVHWYPRSSEGERKMEHTVIWKRLDDTGMEYCTHTLGERTEIEGKVIRSKLGERSFVDYHVVCDAQGNTEEAVIRYIRQNNVQKMHLQKDADHHWTRDGVHLPEFDGLADIDIGATPSTNLLPIRRLRLGIGESRELTAVWVRFPEFDVMPLRQAYTRLGENEYEYRSFSGYTARLRTDAEGIIREYEGEWTERAW